MIVEGIVTSLDPDGQVNIAPMGPIVEGDFQSLLLRPFQPSRTFSNLSINRCGVFHVVDSADLIVLSVINQLTELPALSPATMIHGMVLDDCCRWFEFQVDSVDDSQPRSLMPATIVHRGERRSFRGFNRASHALLEAAIIATRIHLLKWHDIESAFRFLEPAVQRTGDSRHIELFSLLQHFVHARKESST